MYVFRKQPVLFLRHRRFTYEYCVGYSWYRRYNCGESAQSEHKANPNYERSVCDKSNSTNNSIELEKGQLHSGITLTVFTMSESQKFHQITKKMQISYRKKERSVGIAKHSIIFFCEHGEEVPVCDNGSSTAAAKLQHSSSSSSSSRSSSSTAEAAAAAVVAVAAEAA